MKEKQMNRINYQKELDQIIAGLEAKRCRPALLLHSCCAPCSSYCLEYLSRYFDITVYYYNPNITDEEEYRHRVEEQQRLVKEFPGVSFQEGPYDRESFYEMARGLETVPEGGERCFRCYELRLGRAVEEAEQGNYDYVTTTLSISPLKNSQKLNEIGQAEAEGKDVCWLPGDFKKRDGYKRSIQLSAEYHLYRQDYCGCEFSREEARRRQVAKQETEAAEKGEIHPGEEPRLR